MAKYFCFPHNISAVRSVTTEKMMQNGFTAVLFCTYVLAFHQLDVAYSAGKLDPKREIVISYADKGLNGNVNATTLSTTMHNLQYFLLLSI